MFINVQHLLFMSSSFSFKFMYRSVAELVEWSIVIFNGDTNVY